MLLSVANIHKSFSQFDILKGVTFSLQEGEKTVLLGANGAGKTTLCQLINGNLTPDQGRIQLKPGKNINYIRQFEHFSPELTVKKYLHASFSQLHETEKEMQLLEPDLDRGKVQIKYNELLEKYNRLKIFANDRTLKAVLQKTGLTAAVLKQPLTALSGGQKQKVFLCRLKLTRADLILLDEPTNHLDLPALAWLEQYLKQSKAALILITHDEQLLRRTATRILYLQNGVLSSYQGSYQNYLDSFTRHNSLLLKKIKEQTTKMQKAREVIDRFQTGTRANQAKAKQRQLANLELPDMPLQEKEISLPEFPLRQKLPKEILHVKKATAVYKKEPVFKGISFSIFRGEKTALLGPNG
ncbi:MAG TPA: ATP-binding cassette domain-containing protein, partial [Spirochaetota bacterium]|nr:ATP-binding cassette domain-containing protein [Spirochaetota bacterium]